MIYSRILRYPSSLRTASTTRPTRALDSYFHPEIRFRPRSSSRDWIYVYYLQFLDHSPASFPSTLSRVSPPTLFVRHPRLLGLPSVFDAPIAEPWVSRYLLVVSASVATPTRSLLHDESFLRAPRFSPFSVDPSSVFALLAVPVFAPRYFSFVPVDKLVRDNEPVAQLYRLFQSSCPNVRPMMCASVCIG